MPHQDDPHTCPMHPEVRHAGPGSCLQCGTALEPRRISDEEDGENAELADMTRRFWLAAAVRGRTMSRDHGQHQATLTYLITRCSPDVATLFFMEAVSAHDPSESIQREDSDAVRRLMETGETPELDHLGSRLTVAFAPGWFYRS